jgi:hypothetical protein
MLKTALKYTFFSLILAVSTVSVRTLAEDTRGEVIAVDGSVHVIDAAGDRRSVEQAGFVLREADTIVTEEGANAVIQFDDGALSVLEEKSRLRVEKTRWLSHLGGRIYFTFRKIFNGERQIKTRFATLGIRGTTFIVYDDDQGQGVALQEGMLDIESSGPVFEIYRQRELDEFEAFKQQVQQEQEKLRDEFDDFKMKLSREFIEYRDSFALHPGHVVRFVGARVDESMIDEGVEADFENFEAIAGELLEEFRARSQQQKEMIEQEQVLDDEDFE